MSKQLTIFGSVSAYKFLYNGHCLYDVPISSKCPSPCDKMYAPVCGYSVTGVALHKTFNSKCMLSNYNCQNRNARKFKWWSWF